MKHPIILSGTFAVGWSDILSEFDGIVGSHQDAPNDPFALLMTRIRAMSENPGSIITTTFIDTLQDPIILDIVRDLAHTLLPHNKWTQIVLHANQNEFFDRCIHQYRYDGTFHELQEYPMSPPYLSNVSSVHHVYVPQFLADTPDMLCSMIRKTIVQTDT